MRPIELPTVLVFLSAMLIIGSRACQPSLAEEVNQPRVWTDSNGQTVRARLVAFNQGKLLLEESNRQRHLIDVSQLGEADRMYLEQLVGFGAQQSATNAKVLAFAEAQFGKVVGGGQCGELAVAALREAESPFEVDAKRQIVYGKPIPTGLARPGDILVFRRAKFVAAQSGNNFAARQKATLGSPQHIAIVKDVAGTNVVILHQGNSDRPQDGVDALTLDLEQIQSGNVVAYRPNLKSRQVRRGLSELP